MSKPVKKNPFQVLHFFLPLKRICKLSAVQNLEQKFYRSYQINEDNEALTIDTVKKEVSYAVQINDHEWLYPKVTFAEYLTTELHNIKIKLQEQFSKLVCSPDDPESVIEYSILFDKYLLGLKDELKNSMVGEEYHEIYTKVFDELKQNNKLVKKEFQDFNILDEKEDRPLKVNILKEELSQQNPKESEDTRLLNYQSHFFNNIEVVNTLRDSLTNNNIYIRKDSCKEFSKIFSFKPLEVPLKKKLDWKRSQVELRYFLRKMTITFEMKNPDVRNYEIAENCFLLKGKDCPFIQKLSKNHNSTVKDKERVIDDIIEQAMKQFSEKKKNK